MDYQHILATAIEAAVTAANAADDALPPEGARGLDCGFAWVDAYPATHPFIRWCKKQGAGPDPSRVKRAYGRKHWQRGWQWWNPSDLPTQSIGPKEAGAAAFAKALREALPGLSVSAGSRLD